MTSPNEFARRVVVAGHAGQQSVVMQAFDHPEELVREAVVGACERLGNLDESMLITFLGDGSALVRRRALEAAATTAFSQNASIAAQALVLLGDPDPLVAEVAAFALGELGVASPAVIAGLSETARHHSDPLCRESAVAALGALECGLDVILGAMADIATVRRRAVIALSPFEGPDVDAALATALEDRDWQVRQAAEDLSDN